MTLPPGLASELLMSDTQANQHYDVVVVGGGHAGAEAAVEAGMVTLRADGARKVMLGMTTPEEVMLMTAESTD